MNIKKILLLLFCLYNFTETLAAHDSLFQLVRAPHIIFSGPTKKSLLQGAINPQQMRNAYGFTFIPFQGYGQTIAITVAYDSPNIEYDLGVFSKEFNLPACTTANNCFKKIYADGTKPAFNEGWSYEAALDVQWAHAIAPQAKIILVEASSADLGALLRAVKVAISQGASVISNSWCANEFAGQVNEDYIFNNPNTTFVFASGDWGNEVICYPATSPYVLSVGGTALHLDSNGNYINETGWIGSGGGISAYENMPDYQLNFSLPHNPQRRRGIPDVSYNASTGVLVYGSGNKQPGQGGWLIMGGTSAGTPQWAGLIAIIKSALCKKTDIKNNLIYAVAAPSVYNHNFFDITTGRNGSCGAVCNASIGYDYVTGLGSPKAFNLVSAILAQTYT